MDTRIKLKEFLEEISEDAKFVAFHYDSSEKFYVQLRCTVRPNQPAAYYDYANHWINRFANFTSTAWIVRVKYADAFSFRNVYVCHWSADNKKTPAPLTCCKASIHFKVNSIINNAMRRDQFLEGSNMFICIKFVHTHLLGDKVVHNSLNSLSDTTSPFFEYFEEGYTPTAARCYNALRLIEEYGQDSEQLANGNLNPNLRHVCHMYKHYPNQKKINKNEVIIKKIETLETFGHTIRYSENPPFFVILTPLMKRVISQIGVGRVLVDATLEPGTPSTLFLYVPSMVGSLPVTCVVFTEETEAIYLQIFLTIKLAIESEIGVKFAPELWLQDNPKIKQALLTVFSNSMIKYNRFSLCRELWQWICKERLIIKPENTLNAMGIFKSLVYAKSLQEASVIRNRPICSDMPGIFYQKLDEVWQKQQDWLYSGLCDGFNDAPIRFMKEFILQLCKPFTGILPAMLNIVTNVIERHYHKILLSHRDGNATSTYTKFIAKERLDASSGALRKVSPNEYRLQNGTNNYRQFRVSTDLMCCDCKEGQKGRTCEHLCAILNLADNTFVSFSSLNLGEKITFLKLLDDTTIKFENEHDLLDIDETAVDDERSMPSSSSKCSGELFDVEIKKDDQDRLEENREDAPKLNFASEDTSKEELKEQFEASMNVLNDEFQRLNKLFKDNPNKTNLCMMQRLTKELAKVVVVEEADLSNMFVTLNGTSGAGELIL